MKAAFARHGLCCQKAQLNGTCYFQNVAFGLRGWYLEVDKSEVKTMRNRQLGTATFVRRVESASEGVKVWFHLSVSDHMPIGLNHLSLPVDFVRC